MSDRKSGSDRRPGSGPNRRRFLRGLGGVVLALPFLELFADKQAVAQSTSKPKRYVFAFGGSSLGIAGIDRVTPAAEGPLAGQLSRGLLPLGTAEVADVTSIVSGLKIPWGADAAIPAGGRYVAFHSSTPCPLASGMRTAPGDERLRGPTSDWVLAPTIAGDTKNPVLAYRVQAAFYRGSNGTGGTRGMLSARMNGNTLEEVPPVSSPRTAFASLTTGFIPPDPADAARARFLLERRASVADLVRGDTERLIPKLGAADKIRLQRHLDELRALENRLEAVDLPASCVVPDDPGEDPAIGGPVENGQQGSGGGYDSTAAYSDEEKRAAVFVDLVHFAMACDISRIANLMFTYSQCFLNMNPLYGYPTDLHEMGHYSMGGGEAGANAVADGVAWHVKHWANLMKKLRETEDFDGTSMLDSTAMILCFEGGLGYDPEQDQQGSVHSSENMVVLIGGKAGGLHTSPGQHIRKPDHHPVEVINTAMKALGGPSQLGEVSGTIDELFA